MLDLLTRETDNQAHTLTHLAHHPAAEAARGQRPAALANPLLQLLDVLSAGVVLLDDRSQVLHANPAAHALCAAHAALVLVDGQLQTSLAQRQRLDAAVQAALRGQWSVLVLRQRGMPMAVGVVPMDSSATCPSLAAALLIGSDGRPSRLALQFFSQNHGLTAAEASVLGALCDGLKPAQIAAAGGVAVCTVRSQISAVRQKTDASSIGHLMRMVGGMPPIARQACAHRP